MLKRRELLKMGGGSLALAGLGLMAPARAGGPAAGVEAAAGNDHQWTADGARALLGQRFWVNDPAQGAVALTLETVRELPARAAAGAPAIAQFLLYFAGPAGGALAAGNYEMDHDQIGRFALYLIPGEKRTGSRLYRAEFSLLLA